MAFVKEFLTTAQKKESNSWNLKRPIFGFGRIIREIEMEDIWYWVADNDRKMYLIGTSYDRDFMDENVFIFRWNDHNYLVQFNMSFEDDNTVVWNIPKKYLIDDVFPYCREEHFLDDLREALIVHGFCGIYDEEEGSAKCNF